jgi:hypothetical protein
MDWMSLLSKAAPYMGAVGKAASGTASGAAAGRKTEADLNVARDQIANQGYSIGQQAQMNAGSLDLQRKGFEEQARGSRAKQAAMADMLANFKGTNISTPGIRSSTISGGLSVDSPGVQQAMAKMREQALLAQLKGDTPGGEGFTGGNILATPTQTPIPQAGMMEKIMGTAGQVAGWGGLIGDLMKAKKYDTGGMGGGED